MLVSEIQQDYEIDPEALAELIQQKDGEWVFIHAEHDLTDIGERTGLVDVAGQCACGNVEAVLTCDLDAISKATQESVGLRVYFVEKTAYERSRAEKAPRIAKIALQPEVGV